MTGTVGGRAVVTFAVTAEVPVVALTLDLIGDGEPGVEVVGPDLRAVSALELVPRRAGRWWWQVRARDVCGGEDATGVPRWVEVLP